MRKLKLLLSGISVIISGLLIWQIITCLVLMRDDFVFGHIKMLNKYNILCLWFTIVFALSLILILAFNYLIWRYDLIGTEVQRQERKAAAAARKKARLEKELEKLK